MGFQFSNTEGYKKMWTRLYHTSWARLCYKSKKAIRTLLTEFETIPLESVS